MHMLTKERVYIIFSLLCILSNQCEILQTVCSPHVGWQDGLGVDTIAPELSGMGLKPDTAINCRRGVSQTGKGINVFPILRVNV